MSANTANTGYTLQLLWERGEQPFLDQRYSRRHRLRFDGGAEWIGSSSPHIVPLPMSDAAAVDPEESFVAALSACHMLWFLSLAAGRGLRVDRYEDNPVGVLGRNAAGRLAMLRVTLRPRVSFSGDLLPDNALLDALHEAAHDECFIANSVNCEVRCEARYEADPASPADRAP